jgi:hypothetical protein
MQLTQKDVIDVMMGKKLTTKTLREMLSAKYPDADINSKIVRSRVDSLTHSPYVDIEVISVKGKLSLYKLNSVGEKFFTGCSRQAKRIKLTRDKRPPFEPREQLAAIRLQKITHYLTAARAV